jgi:hypothetical protein
MDTLNTLENRVEVRNLGPGLPARHFDGTQENVHVTREVQELAQELLP